MASPLDNARRFVQAAGPPTTSPCSRDELFFIVEGTYEPTVGD
jgi:hypothetical protein